MYKLFNLFVILYFIVKKKNYILKKNNTKELKQ